MKNIMVIAAVVALAIYGAVSHAQGVAGAAQTAPVAAQGVPAQQEQSAPVAGTDSASNGLRDLDAMTFDCPKAALNAAAREAAKVPSQGTYQFAYFSINSNSHHASYEIHFKSNYHGEADLKYCVAMYCQQGWDPKTAKTSVTLIGNERHPMGGAAHGTDCGTPAPVKRR